MTYDLNTLSAARLWPYEPDWKSSFRVTRSFLTDIGSSRNNTEQRRALRDVPRVSVAYSAVASDSASREAELQLRAYQNRPAAVPDFARHRLTTGTSSGGASTLTIASPPAWAAAKRHLVVCRSTGLELVEVVSVAGSTITLADPLGSSVPAGTVIRPAFFGLFSGRLRSEWATPEVSRFDVELRAYPGGEPVEAEGTASDTFNGREVLSIDPDFSSPPRFDFLWPVEQVDFEFGRTAQFRPVERQQGLFEAQYAGLSAADALAFEQLFLRMKGMRGSFYRSTCKRDMQLISNYAINTTFLVDGPQIAEAFGATDFSEVEQAIEIVLTDGSKIRRMVQGITPQDGDSLISIGLPSITLHPLTTARISWLPRVRFASDDLTTEWVTPNFARIGAAFQTVDQ